MQQVTLPGTTAIALLVLSLAGCAGHGESRDDVDATQATTDREFRNPVLRSRRVYSDSKPSEAS